MRKLLAAQLTLSLAWLGGCGEPSQPPVTKTDAAPTGAVTAPNANATETAEAPTAIREPKFMQLPAGAASVLEMARTQVGDAVLIEYVRGTTDTYDLSPEQIIYLRDMGVSEEVLAEMMKRGNEVKAQQTEAAAPTSESTPALTETTLTEPVADAAPPTQLAASASAAEGAPPPPEGVYAQPVSAPQQTYTVSYFQDYLAPYGSWVQLPGYGWCWRPNCAIVDPGWRPYANRGSWVWTSSGWYWNSYYSWGWAPFHYGRWYRSASCGWVWTPGTSWGPAWVTWRTSGAYCGWAPLPPGAGWTAGIGLTWGGVGVSVGFGFNLGWGCYTYVPWRRVCAPRVAHYAATGQRAQNIYNNSTTINNYINGDNNTIVNNGVPPKQMPSSARREVRRAELRDVAHTPGTPVRADRFSRDGRTLSVHRPNIPSQPSASVARATPTARPTSNRTSAGPGAHVAKTSPVARSTQGASALSGTRSTVPSRTSTVATPSRPNASVASSGASTSRFQGRSVPTARTTTQRSRFGGSATANQPRSTAATGVARTTPTRSPATFNRSAVSRSPSARTAPTSRTSVGRSTRSTAASTRSSASGRTTSPYTRQTPASSSARSTPQRQSASPATVQNRQSIYQRPVNRSFSQSSRTPQQRLSPNRTSGPTTRSTIRNYQPANQRSPGTYTPNSATRARTMAPITSPSNFGWRNSPTRSAPSAPRPNTSPTMSSVRAPIASGAMRSAPVRSAAPGMGSSFSRSPAPSSGMAPMRSAPSGGRRAVPSVGRRQ